MPFISEPYRTRTIFNDKGSAKETKIFYAPVGGNGLESLDPSILDTSPGAYSFPKIYDLLHQQYPNVINRENPVLFDNSVALAMHMEQGLHPYIIIKWLTDYVNTSKYFSLVHEGAAKYNLNGWCTTYVTAEDIRHFKALKECFSQNFADPTYDHTFKMIFANEAHKNLLISFLNACLDLSGEKQITEVRILNNDHIPAGVYGIRSAVDVLCTHSNGEKIVVEMQRRFEHYFLPRTQYYMSRLIAGQVQEGDSSTYDIKECWIISIGKTDFFKPSIHGIPTNLPYEVWSRPTIEIPGENGEGPRTITTPQNIMNWKFFSLEKFRKMCENKEIVVTQNSCLKEQFMEFLLRCSTMERTPEDRHEIIREAYEVMKVAHFTPSDYLKLQEEKAEEFFSRLEAKAQEEAQKKLLDAKLAEGKAEGIAKGKIDKLITLLEFTEDSVKLSEKTGFTQEQITTLLGDKEHISVKASQLLGYSYDLLGDTSHDNSGDYS